jgi:putative oxidoreductase
MSVTFLIGRILLVAIFLVTGIFNLLDRVKSAATIQGKFTIPESLSSAAASAQSTTGMTPHELLAIAVAAILIIFSLLIIFNIITRFSALVLLVYTAVVTFFFYDFWNMSGDARALNMTLALQNLSIIGGLLMLFVIGAWRPGAVEDDDYAV